MAKTGERSVHKWAIGISIGARPFEETQEQNHTMGEPWAHCGQYHTNMERKNLIKIPYKPVWGPNNWYQSRVPNLAINLQGACESREVLLVIERKWCARYGLCEICDSRWSLRLSPPHDGLQCA